MNIPLTTRMALLDRLAAANAQRANPEQLEAALKEMAKQEGMVIDSHLIEQTVSAYLECDGAHKEKPVTVETEDKQKDQDTRSWMHRILGWSMTGNALVILFSAFTHAKTVAGVAYSFAILFAFLWFLTRPVSSSSH